MNILVGKLFIGEFFDAPDHTLFMYRRCTFVAPCAPLARGDSAYRVDFYPLELKLVVFPTEEDYGEQHDFEQQKWLEIKLALAADPDAPPVACASGGAGRSPLEAERKVLTMK